MGSRAAQAWCGSWGTGADAQAKASWYRREYNAVRPHSSLGYATPKEFSEACEERRRTHKIDSLGYV
jgi:transposase InsO family protein